MKIEYAIENLGKTLKYDSQKIYFNEIVGWVINQQKISVNENLLFAKLFIHKLNDIKQNDFDPNVTKLNQRAITDILKLDIEDYYKEFKQTLNTNHLNEFFKENGIKTKHPYSKQEDEIKIDELKINNIKESDILEMKKGLWTIDEIKDRLNNMLNAALNKYQ